jgi:protein SCO1/2
MRNISKPMLVVVLAMAAVSLAEAADRRTGPNPATDLHAYTARALRQHFPNVLLTTQNGKLVRFYDDVIKGKIVMIQFMFTNCERSCPMITPNLVKVQQELKSRGAREVKMVSITVDPLHDTPRALHEYAERFHVQPGWQFLTGRKADIDLIRHKLGVYDPDDQKNEHMNVLIMGREPTGQWMAMEALAKPNDIAYTVLRLTDRLVDKTRGNH